MKRVCSVDGCGRDRRKREWCNRHYEMWRRNGDPRHTRTERPCSVDECAQKHWSNGYCRKHWRRWYDNGDALYERPRWMTERPTYGGAHYRLRVERGPAAAQRCVDCGAQAEEWSYDGLDPDELTEVRGSHLVRYSLDLERYEPRCVRCHRAFDGEATRTRNRSAARKDDHGKVPWPVETVAA